MSAQSKFNTVNTTNMQETISTSNRKLHVKVWGELETEISCGFSHCGEKYFLVFYHSNQNWEKKRVMLQSTPLIKTQEKPQHQPFIYSTAQPQILPATPGHKFGGFCLFLCFFLKRCLLLLPRPWAIQDSTTPDCYELWGYNLLHLYQHNSYLYSWDNVETKR